MRKHQLIVAAFLICAGFALSFAGRAFAEGITISSDTTWQPGAYTYDNVLVTNGATLTFNGAVTLNANNLTVGFGSSISADGKGYPAGQGPGAGKEGMYLGAGGTYGGKGGEGSYGVLGDSTYGSAIVPVELGSGGGTTSWNTIEGGSGGGAIRLNILGTLTLGGLISANGNEFSKSLFGNLYYSAGGSGGSIYILANSLSGSGAIEANGGGKNLDGWGGGGGGRIAVYYRTSSFSGKMEAKGGASGSEDGTVVFIDTQNNILYPSHSFRFQENDSPFNFNKVILDNSKVTSQGIISLTTDELIIKNNSSLTLGGLATSVKLNNLNLTSSSLTLNDSLSLTVSSSLYLNTNSSLTSNAASSSFTLPSITVNNSSILAFSGKELLSVNEITLTNNSILTHIPEGKLNLNLNNLTIDQTSAISADGKGYPAGQGPGAGKEGMYLGAGGTYGGKGGEGSYGVLGDSTYGSAIVPVELGSGGGTTSWNTIEGGSGGGAIRLNILGTLTLGGLISANGNEFSKSLFGNLYYSAGGSGGSIYILANSLSGSGAIEANGGGKNLDGWGGGGGGRIAVYYRTSSFSGKMEAKGGASGSEDGTVVFQPISLDTPLTTFNLIEKSSTTATSQETFSTQQLTLSSVQINGDLKGSLNFTRLELITLTSGSFSKKGFSEGEFEIHLEGASYKGSWQGVVYPVPSENRIYLKGIISGDLNGIAEGYLTESTPGSGTYDTYQAAWKLTRLGTEAVSISLNLEGTLSSSASPTFNSEIYLYQGNLEGSAFGHYTGPLSAVVTHLRITGENEYKGEGFSFISFHTNFGQGEGYSYNQAVSEGIVDFQGLFQSPLLGKLQATLDETKNPKTLSGTIERLDLGAAPAPDLKVKVWGPTSVSPGQTFDYIIELRNDGLKAAEKFKVVDEFAGEVTYRSNVGEGVYKDFSRNVVWSYENFEAKSKKYVSVKGEVVWGLPAHSFFGNIVTIPKEDVKIEIDPAISMTNHVQEATENMVKMKTTFQTPVEVKDMYSEISVLRNWREQMEPTLQIYQDVGGLIHVILEYTYLPSGSILPDRVRVALETSADTIDQIQRVRGFVDIGIEAVEIIEDNLIREKDAAYLYRDGKIDARGLEDLQSKSRALMALNGVVVLARRVPGPLGDWFRVALGGVVQAGELLYGRAVLQEIAYKDMYAAISEYRKENSYSVSVHTNEVMTAHDPNELLVSPEGDVRPGDKLSYTINYENEGEGDAYGVYIIDTLEEDLDDTTLVVNDGGQYDPDTRTITWFIGELLSKQKGAVTFSVNVQADAQDGSEVINFATVYFPSVPEITRTNGTVNRITTSIDNVAPTTTASVSPVPNSAGWNNSDVTVTLTATDNEGGSGVAKTEYSLDNISWTIYNAPFTVVNEGVTIVYYKSTDTLNNVESANSLEIKLDKTSPVIIVQSLPQPNSSGWNNSDVTVSFTAADTLSGVSTYTQPQTITTEGKDQIIGGEAVDFAGNRAAIDVSINIDKTPPAINALSSPPPNSHGWNNSDVTVSFTATDNLSGVISVTSPITVTTEGANQLISGEAQDLAGNTATTSLTLNIDKTSPEAKIYFAQDKQNLEVEGIDNLSVPEVIQQGSIFTITDKADNRLQLTFDELKQHGKEIKAELSSLQYNTQPLIQLPETELKYEWSVDKDSSGIKELEQEIEVEDQFKLKAKYNHQKNETKIKSEGDREKESGQRLPGLVILKLLTKSGTLSAMQD